MFDKDLAMVKEPLDLLLLQRGGWHAELITDVSITELEEAKSNARYAIAFIEQGFFASDSDSELSDGVEGHLVHPFALGRPLAEHINAVRQARRDRPTARPEELRPSMRPIVGPMGESHVL